MRTQITLTILMVCSMLASAQSFSISDFSSSREITSISNTTSGGETRSMIAYGDFNGDGKNDLVKAGGSQIEILQNVYTSGDIISSSTNLFNNLTLLSTNSNTKNVVVGDINQDGKPDILVGSGSYASVFINNSTISTISFETRVDYTSYGANVNLFDIDGDSYLDIVHSDEANYSKIGIVLNNGLPTGTFSSTVYDFTVSSSSMEDWVFADFDGDGDKDFFSARASTNSAYTGIYLALNNSTSGSISFAALDFRSISGMTYASYGSPKAVDAADIDGDGKLDAVVQLGNKTHIFLNGYSSGTISISDFTESNITSQNSTANFALNIGVGDLNGDGKNDLVLPGSNTSGTFALKNNSTSGAISFGSSLDIKSITNQTALLVDLDGDSKLEVVSAQYYSTKIHVIKYLGTFTPPNSAPTDITLTSVSIAENESIGTPVGFFTSTDSDSGDSFTYSLVAGTGDTDNTSFNIPSGTATLTSAAAFDYETKSSYSILVQTSDGTATYTKTFIIAVEVPNPAVTISSPSTNIKMSETATITFTVSHNDTNFGLGDVSLESSSSQTGSLSTFTAVSSTTFTVQYTPPTSFSGTVSLTIPVGTFSKTDGKLNTLTSTLALFIDTIAPTISTLTHTHSDAIVRDADTVPFIVTFTEPMASSPKISIGSLVTNASMTVSPSTSSQTWTVCRQMNLNFSGQKIKECLANLV